MIVDRIERYLLGARLWVAEAAQVPLGRGYPGFGSQRMLIPPPSTTTGNPSGDTMNTDSFLATLRAIGWE